MALNKPALIASLTSVFSDVSQKTAAQKAQEIGDAIDTFVKSGQVNVGIQSTGAVTSGVGIGGTVSVTSVTTGVIS